MIIWAYFANISQKKKKKKKMCKSGLEQKRFKLSEWPSQSPGLKLSDPIVVGC